MGAGVNVGRVSGVLVGEFVAVGSGVTSVDVGEGVGVEDGGVVGVRVGVGVVVVVGDSVGVGEVVGVVLSGRRAACMAAYAAVAW